jgi:hypothetical protein
MLRRPFLALLAIAGFVAAIAGCSKSSNKIAGPQESGFGRVNVVLTDAPADVDHIFLDVREVWAHRLDDGSPGDDLDDDGEHEDGGAWHRLDAEPQIIDLLELRNGVFVGLATGTVPGGTYDQIRLKLGSENTIVVDGVEHSLKVPSGQSSGYKLKGTFHVPVDGVVDVGLDFDAEHSVHETGNGQWMLKPVVRIHEIVTTGRIRGQIAPGSAISQVYAVQGSDIIATTESEGDGHFVIALLPAGEYMVRIVPTVEGFRDTLIGPVQVHVGETTELGVIELGGGPVTPTTGRLIGAVSPSSFPTRVILSQSGTPHDSVDTGAGGEFAFEDLAPGTWELDLHPSSTDYQAKHVGGLSVSAGATTNAGTITLEPVVTGGTGSVSGTVVPGDVSTWVILLNSGDAAVDSILTTPVTGAFAFQGVAAGAYGLVLKPPVTYETRFFGPFNVTAGTNHDLGQIFLTPAASGVAVPRTRTQ